MRFARGPLYRSPALVTHPFFPAVIHEIGHAAGFYHQHTRADRDEYVEILYDNIIPEQQHNFRKYTSGVDILEYDFESVMHYSSRAWRKADAEGEYTILALDPQYQDTMGGYDLSPLDARKVKIMYDEVQPDACIHTIRVGETIDRMIATYQVFRGLTNLNWKKVRKLNKEDIDWGLCPDADPSEPIVPFVVSFFFSLSLLPSPGLPTRSPFSLRRMTRIAAT